MNKKQLASVRFCCENTAHEFHRHTVGLLMKSTPVLAISEDQLQGFSVIPLGWWPTHRAGSGRGAGARASNAGSWCDSARAPDLVGDQFGKGALVAWEVDQDKLDAAFDYMFQEDPFSGHVVTRSTDVASPGSTYKLWTTLKVPQGYSLEKHCEVLKEGGRKSVSVDAGQAVCLGCGACAADMEPGARSRGAGGGDGCGGGGIDRSRMAHYGGVKREFEPEELVEDLWVARAEEAGVSLEEFFGWLRI